MSNTIKLKKSSVAAKVPLASDLDYGELAINYTDGNLFFKDSSNNIQTLASTQFVSVTGNVTGNYFIGDGSQLTGIAQSTSLYGDGGGMGQTSHPVTSTGDAGSVTAAATDTQDLGSITQAAIPVQYVAKDVDILSVVSVTGNITVGNILTDGYFYANGAPFGGGGSSYTDANVATFLSTAFGSNVIVTTGNITAGNFAGDGSQITNVFANIANIAYSVDAANVSGTVANATYADSAGSASTAGTAATVTDAAQPNITSVGTLSSLSATGNVVAGNILTDGYFYANGTPFGSTYGDSNVVTLLAAFGSNTIVTTGNIDSGNIITTGIVSATGNITSGNVNTTGLSLTGNVLGNLATTANIQGGNLIANDGIYGNIYTTLIDSEDSSAITVTPELVCASDLTIQNDLFVNRIDSQDSGEILVTPAVRMESDLQVENALTVRQEINTLSVTATGSVTASQYFGDGGSLSNIATLTQAAGLAIALGS